MKAKNTHWQIIQPVRKTIYQAMAISALSVCFSLIAMLSLAFFVGSTTGEKIRWQWFYVALISTIATYLSRGLAFKTSHLAAFSLERILRHDLTAHLSRLSLGSLQQQGAAALTKIIRDDVRELHVFVADSTPLYVRSYLSPVLTFLLLLWINWQLAIVAIVILAVGMVVISAVMSSSAEISERFNQSREMVNQAVIEFIQAMPVVRTFDSGKASFGRYEKALDHYLSILLKWYAQSGRASRLSMLFLNPLPTLMLLVWAGGYGFFHHQLSFTHWLAVLLLGTGMAEAWVPLMVLYHLIEKSKISANRITALQALPPLPISENPQLPQQATVAFENVSFRYPEREENALEEVSFVVPSGSFTALVGASGAGKSTVARLIPRFWDVSHGSVKIGGVDVREIAPETLMRQVAFVFQENFLFSGTIADNIRLGEEKTMEEVVIAAQAAQADGFIRELPNGYNTEVGERGAKLSGGQRQRITIARAILQNRPILVLDEATAFTDAENEALLMEALQQLMVGKTVLMIAHRLSTIQNADQILFFAGGKLVEQGTPAELLAQPNSAYATLWHAYQKAQNWQIQTGQNHD